MCIVVCKPMNVDVPSIDTLRNCFINNSDGCGFMISKDNNVMIEKGFMNFKRFKKKIKTIQKKDAVVFHFRIATSGKICPELTHPFPVSCEKSDLMQTEIICDMGIAHNGILGSGTNVLSDTQIFIMDILSNQIIKNNLENSAIDYLISHTIGTSKIAILKPDGSIIRYGDNWIEKDSVFYSNSSFKDKTMGIGYVWEKDVSYSDLKNYYKDENWKRKDFETEGYEQTDESYYSDEFTKCPLCFEIDNIDCISSTNVLYECLECGAIYNEKGKIIEVY